MIVTVLLTDRCTQLCHIKYIPKVSYSHFDMESTTVLIYQCLLFVCKVIKTCLVCAMEDREITAEF